MNVTKNTKIIKRKEEPKFIFNENNINIVNSYIAQDILQDKSELTIYPLKRNAIIFLAYLEKQNIDIQDINTNVIEKYIDSLPNYYSRFTKKNTYKYLKDFLKYLYKIRIVNEKLYLFIPNIKVSSYSKIPSVFTDNEIKEIFNAIDRNCYSGRLIYAISLLALRYGLRTIDIKNLKFENIDWKNRKIKLIQSKTKVPIELPLLDDIADALIDYIKNARSKSKTNYIFVNLKGKQYSINTKFHYELSRFVDKTNLDLNGRKKGIYSFKHSLASRLLKENIPLPIISSILGHTSTISTLNYIKVDNNQLKKCCLNVEDIYD